MTKQDYERRLEEIEFYQIHPQYLPFVGERYAEHSIVVIGESHYIRPEENEDNGLWHTLRFYDGWWDRWGSTPEQKEFERVCGEHYRTRTVCEAHIKRTPEEHSKAQAHGIFENITQVLWGCMGTPAPKVGDPRWIDSFQCCAYMNFFQFPAHLREGIKASWDKFELEGLTAKEKKKKWDKMVEASFGTVDAVIKKLDPSIIIFFSCLSADTYRRHFSRGKGEKLRWLEAGAKAAARPIFIRSCHPAARNNCWKKTYREKTADRFAWAIEMLADIR